MAPTRALPIHNPPRSPSVDSPPASPSRFKRSIKGMRNLLMRHEEREPQTQDKDGLAVAVTLTAEVRGSATMDMLQPKNETFEFLSQQEHYHSNNHIKAYVHYEPSRGLIAIGNNPDTKHAKTLWLTLEQYAWIVRQLQQEQSAYDTIRSLSTLDPSSAPLLGIVTEFTQTSFTRRLSRLMQRAKHHRTTTLLLLPKSLLMHAAAYVPMTKPLPPPLPSKHHYEAPFETLPQDLYTRLHRYVRFVALSMHELKYDQDNNLTCKCSDSSSISIQIRVIPNSSDISSSSIQGDATFPVSYLHTSLDPRRRTFDNSFPATPTPSSRPKTYSAIECVTDSVIDPFDSLDTDKRGYIAMDDENEEIIVTFPGIPASGLLFENTSFMPVPWHESDESFREEWVLECAVTAWRRCELTVATALMRVCRTSPYRVVIIGHSLGGAVAALCASSLVTTGLLVDRPVTLCMIDCPRVGNSQFVNHLAQSVETIRLTHSSDILSNMPPRTSGLLHVGSTTVTLDQDAYMLKADDLSWIEDHLSAPFITSNNPSVWGINLYTSCQS